MACLIYFGVPGSGKTTHAASVVYRSLKKGIPVYANVDIKGAVRIDASNDLGKYQIEDCNLIIDEASIEYNNRNFKSLPKSQIAWFKLARHYGIRNIYIYSQSYEDMDITLRRLSDKMYLIRRSIIPFCFSTREISKKIGIDDDTHQIIDQFFFRFLGHRLYFGPKYWPMFDSWEAPALDFKDWYLRGFPDTDHKDPRQLKALFKLIRKDCSFINRIRKRLFPKSIGKGERGN